MKQHAAIGKFLIIAVTIGAIGLQWATDEVKPQNFVWQVPQTQLFPFLETPFLYSYLHLFALIPVLALSFDRRVHFYTHWKALFPALFIVAIVFWIWDIFKTAVGVWGFNPHYYTFLLINLPIEEWFFFITFPFASVFIYECLNAYFPKDRLAYIERYLTPIFIVIFLFIGIFYWQRAYTATTFLACGGFLLYHYIYVTSRYRSRFYRSLLVGYIPFVIVNGVLTGTFTQQPVVVYNPAEYLGTRLISIPLDDFIYNFILQFSVITWYEFFKEKWKAEGTK